LVDSVAAAVADSTATAAVAEEGDCPLSHNLNGQRLGRKGRDTRERILAAATELLATAPRETPISLSAVARQATLGLTSLYNYFADLTELLVALLEPVMATAQDSYLAELRERWPDAELAERSYRFVRAYYDFWAKHSRLMHLRNTLSDTNDERMTIARLRATQPIIRLLVEQMGGDPRALRSRAFGMATVLMIGTERAVTTLTDSELPIRLAADIQHDADHFLLPCARLVEMAIRDMRAQLALA
jgi:AcrR family transcriptional regulator